MGRFQFSLRMMLAAVAVVGIGAGLWVADPSWQVGAVEALLIGWVLAFAALLSVDATGRARAFWMGVAVGCIWPVLVYVPLIGVYSIHYGTGTLVSPLSGTLDWFQYFLTAMSASFRPLLLSWAFAPVVGLLCVFTHWLFIRPPEPKA